MRVAQKTITVAATRNLPANVLDATKHMDLPFLPLDIDLEGALAKNEILIDGRLKGCISQGQPRSIGGTAGTPSAPAPTFAGRWKASSHSVAIRPGPAREKTRALVVRPSESAGPGVEASSDRDRHLYLRFSSPLVVSPGFVKSRRAGLALAPGPPRCGGSVPCITRNSRLLLSALAKQLSQWTVPPAAR